MYQQYVIAGELPNNLASAPSWVDEVYEDVYHEGDMTGTEIHLYSNDENTFGGYVAGGSSCLQGVSRCTGKSVPEFGLRPLFAITCGANKYVGSDRYHFAPPRANETETIRPYACDGELPSVRPTWKLLGFFPEGSCDFLIGASYDKDFCATSVSLEVWMKHLNFVDLPLKSNLIFLFTLFRSVTSNHESHVDSLK